ncbi:TonB-dependent receptor [Chitinophaga eiseniae]|uniref:TonB-dependent receptor n=1 Tax=Chitinophaga eiseniae TaxID=634771 RepID=A0A847SQV3_9BACT|nr:TonB-dependent receptor [Chitinophaga eiseniae]NLR81357.1 TonB-dependent receptor [Chitinophaga eiseniae]
MKLTAFLLTVACLHVNAGAFSQNVSISVHNAPLKKVFNEIRKQTKYNFLYPNELLDRVAGVTVDLKSVPLEKALHACLENSFLEYSIVEKTVIIKQKTERTPVPPPSVEAVENRVRGKVTDENGSPLPGVSVVLKGTNKGASTDNNGEYAIVVPDGTSKILVYSFIGMEQKEVNIGSKTEINVVLKQVVQQQQEIVVVGYGTQKKVNLTGSVATVKGADLAKRQVINPVAALEGMLPGVQITQNSGQPGAENLNVLIRGQGTYSPAGSAPLVLINGVPGNLSDYSPTMIESISVLKDAASASIYGARAANGVILVTLKSGINRSGKVTVSYDFAGQMAKATRLPKFVTNSAQYMELFNQANINGGVNNPDLMYPQSVIDQYKNSTDPSKYPNADWQGLMFRTAPTYLHNISISGGSKTSYDASISYNDQQGIMRGFSYRKYNALFNMTSEVSQRLRAGLTMGLKSGDQSQPINGADDAYYQALAHPPTALPWVQDGSGRYTYRAFPWEYVRPNQFAANEQVARNVDYAANAQLWLDLKLFKGLNWYTKGAVNGYFNKNKAFGNTIPTYNFFHPDSMALSNNIPAIGLSEYMDQTIYKSIYTYLNYDNAFGDHHIGVQAGYSQEEENYSKLSGSRPSFSTGSTLQELNAGDATPQFNGGTSNTWALRSVFGRAKYDFKGKYLFEFNMRYDGSSRLAPEKRFGIFPSASAGWRISEERFMDALKSRGIVNDMKLRASWGKLGNQNIGNYPYQALVNLGNPYPFGNTLQTGAYVSGLNNENITWEETTMSDAGLDLTMFNHFNLVFDIYRKQTENILRTAQVAYVVGLTPPTVNSGAMRNTGMELAISYNNSIKSGAMKDFSYNVGFNISGFRNTTVKFGAQQDNGNTVIKEGTPWNSWYLLQMDGIFQTQDEVNKAPKQFGDATQAGDIRYKDTNNDGVIDNNDRVVMTKGVFPSFVYGATISLAWKGFDLYTFLQGVKGQYGFYSFTAGLTPFYAGTPPMADKVDKYWTPQNHSNTDPILYFYTTAGAQRVWSHPSTYQLFDKSYMRVKQMQVGYTVPAASLSKTHVGLSYLRIFVAADNFLTFTKFPGTDPEKPQDGGFLSYPQNKAFSFGISAKF